MVLPRYDARFSIRNHTSIFAARSSTCSQAASLLVLSGCLLGLLVTVPSVASAQSTNYSPVKPAGGDEERSDSESAGDSSASEQTDDLPAHLAYCREFVESYIRSSARKLYRALSGQGFDLEKIELGEAIELEVGLDVETSRRVEFGVHRENDDRVAGLVDQQRDYRRTFVVASTDAGPLIASQKWPAFDDIATKAECRPTSSRVEYPEIATATLDIEPFKFWGLRVIWRLPRAFKKGDHDRDSLRDTLAEVLK